MARYVVPFIIGASCQFEQKDCSVRALSNAMQISYEEAHAKIHSIGRKQGKPVDAGDLSKFYREAGLKMQIVGTTKLADYFHRIHRDVEAIEGRTVENMVKQLQTGRHIVNTKGHVFAVVHGLVLDKGMMKAGTRVVAVYSVPSERSVPTTRSVLPAHSAPTN